MKSTYCTAISKSDDISTEKTFLLQSISPSLLGETTQEKAPFLLGKSKGQADQIDFDTFLKTEKVAKLEWRKPPNFTFTAAGYAGYACSCSSVSKLGPRARSCFRADLYLEVGSLRPLSDRLLGCRYGRQVAELNLRPSAGTTCQPIWTSTHFPKIWSWSICCRILEQKSIHYKTELYSNQKTC